MRPPLNTPLLLKAAAARSLGGFKPRVHSTDRYCRMALAELPGPYEILELRDGESITLRVRDWRLGVMRIRPRTIPGAGEKIIKVLRLYLPREVKPVGPDYYDITSQTLIYQLLPFLERPDFRTKTFKITAYGVAPRKRFTVEVT